MGGRGGGGLRGRVHVHGLDEGDVAGVSAH